MRQTNLRIEANKQASEVLIVGGSAAGLFAAYLLAREGKRVRLFDANDVQHTASRTLITTSRLTDVLGFVPQEAIVNEINEIEIFSRQRSVTIPMRQADLVVERAAIVRLLAQKALQAGVEICGGCKFLNLDPGGGGVTVTIHDTHCRSERPRNHADLASDRQACQRRPAENHPGVVSARRYALLLLADSRVAKAGGGGLHS
ncbi:MAG: FAD-dependent monooxygenase [Deltaproteobacteria bacterium]|nr:FAD-dependent monooxygenase [Deltaproteobacteria bacterium]